MKATFKNETTIDGHRFTAGAVHNIPKFVEDHWFFQGLIKENRVTIVEEPKTEAQPAAMAQEEDVEVDEKPKGKPNKGNNKNFSKR